MKLIKHCLHTLVAIVLIFLTASCGQSGALYIPGDPSQMTVPPAETNAEENEEEEPAARPQ